MEMKLEATASAGLAKSGPRGDLGLAGGRSGPASVAQFNWPAIDFGTAGASLRFNTFSCPPSPCSRQSGAPWVRV